MVEAPEEEALDEKTNFFIKNTMLTKGFYEMLEQAQGEINENFEEAGKQRREFTDNILKEFQKEHGK